MMNRFSSIFALAILGTLISCGGGSTEPTNGGPTAEPGTFTIEVRQSLADTTPVAGVTVVLYDADDKTITQEITTDNTGLANFNNGGRDRGSLGFYYLRKDNRKTIKSFIQIGLRDRTFYLNDPTCTTTKSLNLTVSNAASTFTYVTTQDNPQKYIPATGTTVTLCPDAAQKAKIFVWSTVEGVLDQYRLVEVDLSAAMPSHNVDFTAAPTGTSVSWTAAANLQPTDISGHAMLDGETYPLGFNRSRISLGQYLANQSIRFSAPLANADYYAITEARRTAFVDIINGDLVGEANTQRWRSRAYATLPSSFTVDFNSREVPTLSYSGPASKTFSYTTTGSGEVDFIQLKLLSKTDGFGFSPQLVWTLIAPTDRSSITLMDLPSTATDWFIVDDTRNEFDLDNPSATKISDLRYTLSYVDSNAVTNFDDMVDLLFDNMQLLNHGDLAQGADHARLIARPR